MINRQGRVVISDLSRHFKVSSVTARADINALSKRDLLVRSHGGAIRKADVAVDFPLDVKESQHHEEKVRIGIRSRGPASRKGRPCFSIQAPRRWKLLERFESGSFPV